MYNLATTLFSKLHLPVPFAFVTHLGLPKYHYFVPKHFLTSKSAQLVNPRGHRVAVDSVALRIPTKELGGLRDEEVLARFGKGFFGGWVFGPERVIAWLGAWRLVPVGYEGLETEQGSDTSRSIWWPSEISTAHVPAVGTKFYNAFQVVDTHLKADGDDEEVNPSYVDVAFGHPSHMFAGCHRFTIERGLCGLEGEGEEAWAEISLVHFRCNPREDKENIAEWISWFHKVYALTLFMDGVKHVLKSS